MFKTLWVFLLCCTFSLCANGQTLHVAVASNFRAPMVDLAQLFEQKTGHKVVLSFGSSGKIFAQITHGAPYDAFFSADQQKPLALEKQGLVVPGSRFTYAQGVLVLWSKDPTMIGSGAQALKANKYSRIALANPRLAPYGLAAQETLAALNLLDLSRGKWAKAENIAQAYQFTASGNADLGFVAKSQVYSQGKLSLGSAWVVPSELHSPITQDAVLIAREQGSSIGAEFFQFFKTETAKRIIGDYGYLVN